MEGLADVVMLDRVQFAATALYHFLFVPLSIGFGLVLAILQTKAYKTRDPHDEALARFWLRLFTGTFAVGVATGITMEFSFGTNWADYSRFVGDVFGAPLAAEALFAFFLESVFLGILLFGRNKVSRKLYLASGWLVWIGSMLSALWILIANSWMQTPAGYEIVEVDGKVRAIMTDFFTAAINNSTIPRYLHTIMALLIMGSLVAVAIGAYYKLKNRDHVAGQRLLKVGLICGIVTTVLMLPAAHMQAVEVADFQPSKLAAMEGQFEEGPVELSLFGWVDEESQTTWALGIPGGTSFLATGTFDASYPGLNDFPEADRPGAVNLIFQSYHLMVALFGVIVIVLILAALVLAGKLKNHKWPLYILMFGWIAPIVAIEFGWIVAEVGRQPWIVWGELRTADAISEAVPASQVIITLVLFAIVYAIIYIAWARSFLKTVKRGPEVFLEESDTVTVEAVADVVCANGTTVVTETDAVVAPDPRPDAPGNAELLEQNKKEVQE